ncbi:MAG: hypothetical protein HY904_01020 [Deltaproteobacteria bacterium]|nr:hypothetical protein [Deltaproteobacteria bacterium]
MAWPLWAWCGAWLGACHAIASTLGGNGGHPRASLVMAAVAGLLFARRDPPPPGPVGRVVPPGLLLAAACAALTFLDARAWHGGPVGTGLTVATQATLALHAYVAGQLLPAVAQFNDRRGRWRGALPALALLAPVGGWLAASAAWNQLRSHPRAPLLATLLFVLGALTPVLLRRVSIAAALHGEATTRHAFSTPSPPPAARSALPWEGTAALVGALAAWSPPAALALPAVAGACLRVRDAGPHRTPRTVARLVAASAAGALVTLALTK